MYEYNFETKKGEGPNTGPCISATNLQCPQLLVLVWSYLLSKKRHKFAHISKYFSVLKCVNVTCV